MSKIVKANAASIAHNDRDGVRVSLSIAQADDGRFFVETDSGEDTEARFATAAAAEESIYARWSSGWDLQYA